MSILQPKNPKLALQCSRNVQDFTLLQEQPCSSSKLYLFSTLLFRISVKISKWAAVNCNKTARVRTML